MIAHRNEHVTATLPKTYVNQAGSQKRSSVKVFEGGQGNSGSSVKLKTLDEVGPHANLDSYQVKAGKITGKDTSVPVIHLAELVAFALGHFPDRLAQLRTRAMIIGG